MKALRFTDAQKAFIIRRGQVGERIMIENFFAKIKEFKGIAMRSEKTDRNYSSMIFACAAVIRLR